MNACYVFTQTSGITTGLCEALCEALPPTWVGIAAVLKSKKKPTHFSIRGQIFLNPPLPITTSLLQLSVVREFEYLLKISRERQMVLLQQCCAYKVLVRARELELYSVM